MSGVENITIRLEELAEKLVFAELEDADSFSEIKQGFVELFELVKKEDEVLGEYCSAVGEVIDKIKAGSTEESQKSLQLVEQTIASLQRIFRDGCELSEVFFPKELGVVSQALDAPEIPPEIRPPKKRTARSGKKAKKAAAKPKKKTSKSAAKQNKSVEESEALEKNSTREDNSAIEANFLNAIESDSELVGDFIQESRDHLDACDEHMLAIEKDETDSERLNAIFRAFHTIKGVASFLNLEVIRTIAHKSENLLDLARDNKIKLEGELLEIVFRSIDTLKKLLSDLENTAQSGTPAVTADRPNELIARLEALINSEPQNMDEKAGESVAVEEAAEEVEEVGEVGDVEEFEDFDEVEEEEAIEGNYENETDSVMPLEIVFSEIPRFVNSVGEHVDSCNDYLLSLEKDPSNGELINSVFRSFHTIKGDAGFLALKNFESLAHKAESLLGRARNQELVLTEDMFDVIFKTLDMLKNMNGLLEESTRTGELRCNPQELPDLLAHLEQLANGGDVSTKVAPAPKVEEKALISREESAAKTSEIEPDVYPDLKEESSVEINEPRAPDNVIREAEGMKSGEARKPSVIKEILKVDAERLDRLVNTIGELVIAESMVAHSDEIRHFASPTLLRYLSQLDKITRELQEMGMSLRMVPLRGTFQKMARLARDLSHKIGKKIDFQMLGEETELDKAVVDKIGDPLVHMVRNAIDHGIEETSAERLALGKSEVANVRLSAFHKGGSIYIQIEDDGRGLDRDAILAKAREREIIGDGDMMEDKDVFNLIFHPGFSTAKKVTEVSGRGVGMDVVRRNIEALRGQIDIESVKNEGSVFRIRLPLTLAIIDGMVVRIGTEFYILPTLTIESSVNVRRTDILRVQGRGEMISLLGGLVPVFHLDSLFNIKGGDIATDDILVVIVEAEGRKVGVVIDEIIGQQQIVIKTLGDYLRNVTGLSGGAIMSDGTVGLIVDVSGIVKLVNS